MIKNNKITILYVHANNEDIGGADYCLFKLAAELDKKKFRPIVCLSEKTKILDLYDKEGIKTYIINMKRIRKTKNPIDLIKLFLNFFPTILRLKKIIKDEKVDIVHGNDLLDIYGPVAGKLSSISVTQYVRWILVTPLWLKNILTRLVHYLNDVVITVSDGVAKEMFSSASGAPMPNVISCYDWIDMDKVGHSNSCPNIKKEYNIPENVPVIGCVGRLEQWKGQDIFIKSASAVLEFFPESRFLIVGGGVNGRGRENFSNQLKKLGKKLNIENRLIFTGHRSDILNVMSAIDIFVHSSLTPDPLPGVVMEAMYCSRPVIGANAGGVPEEVEDGVTGFLYPPGDASKMAEKILTLLKSPETCRDMGIAGKKRVEKFFNKNKLCAEMENIYQGMLNNSVK